jgi:hypothetical protein
MTKRLININDKSVKNIDLNETQLSILINLDGFSFCIYQLPEKRAVVYQHFAFEEKAITPEKHLLYIQSIFEENTFLNHSFKKVTAIHQNELATIVPNELFNKDNLKEYLKHSIKLLDNDFISHEKVKKTKNKTVYIPFVNINNFFFNRFGPFEYFHSFTKLIEIFTTEDSKDTSDKIFLNVNSDDFELLAFKKNHLQVINRFGCKTPEDFIYYVLFVSEQLNFDTEDLKLTLTGDINKHSERYKILYKYIRNVEFLSTDKQNLSDAFLKHPKHLDCILLSESLA